MEGRTVKADTVRKGLVGRDPTVRKSLLTVFRFLHHRPRITPTTPDIPKLYRRHCALRYGVDSVIRLSTGTDVCRLPRLQYFVPHSPDH